MSRREEAKPAIGWREWVTLPDLGIPRIKAKIDTGARSSALHAFDIQVDESGSRPRVRFLVHPYQRNSEVSFLADAYLLDQRPVRNSGGKVERRIVISTSLCIAGDTWPIELTLTNRDEMGFRMLLGREAIRGRYCVDPGRSFLFGRELARKKS